MQTKFIDKMKKHWVQTRGLAYSEALIEGWLQIEHATCRSSYQDSKIQVLTLPTGAGKTEAIKVLCSVHDIVQHPGALIVTKFCTEADRIANDINQLASGRIAIAVHSEATKIDTELGFIPVVVITHAAFRLALQGLADAGSGGHWERLRRYGGGHRSWLIIDEAFDWTDGYSINLGSMRSMAGDLAGVLQDNLQRHVLTLHGLVATLTDIDRHGTADRVLSDDQFKLLTEIPIEKIAAQLAGLSADIFTEMMGVEHTEADTGTGEELKPVASKAYYLNMLQQLQTVVRIGNAWVSRRRSKSFLNASRYLLDVLDMSAVVLDATASVDPTYELRDEIRVHDRPRNIRRYENVTLYISTGHSVGKDYLTKHGAGEWSKVWGDLQGRIQDRSVLVCGHKDVLPNLRGFVANHQDVRITNWGRIDGMNNWNTCDTVVLFGLPYLDTISPAQTYLAACGPQKQDWFGGERRHGVHTDIRTALNDGFLARSIVQAVNRVRCRNAIDTYGNCEQTDVFLLLPNGRVGEHIQRAIVDQMPGIKVRNWNAKGATRKARKRPTEERLVSHFVNADLGIYSKSSVVEAIGTNVRSFERITLKLRNSESALAINLASYGVRYNATTGRGKEAYFIKK